MQESNGSEPQAPSTAPSGRDFGNDLKHAQMSGDYEFVIDTARKSHALLIDFRETIKRSQFPGKEAATIAQGLNFLENMILQSSSQLEGLKRAEKQAREQIKAALKLKKENPMQVIEPQGPEEPAGDAGGSDAPAAPAPETPASLPGSEGQSA